MIRSGVVSRALVLIPALLMTFTDIAPGSAAEAEVTAEGWGRAPRHQLGLELAPVMLALSYNFAVGADTAFGARVGIGAAGAPISAGGSHFGSESSQFLEILPVEIYLRHFLGSGFELETGIRWVGGLHKDDSDDDSSGASFSGFHAGLYWGSRYVSIGTRLSAGMFEEGGSQIRFSEGGVIWNPILLRFATDR